MVNFLEYAARRQALEAGQSEEVGDRAATRTQNLGGGAFGNVAMVNKWSVAIVLLKTLMSEWTSLADAWGDDTQTPVGQRGEGQRRARSRTMSPE